MNQEDRRTALTQDWENFRYQDGLRWSKIQTIAAIEAGFIAAIYASPQSVTLPMRFVLAVFAFLLVASLCALAEKDGRDARVHLNRAIHLEKSIDIPQIELSRRVFGISGHLTMRIAMLLLNGMNVMAIIDIAARWYGAKC